jgi:hypothetical protein
MCENLDCKSYFSCLKFINIGLHYYKNIPYIFCLLKFHMFPKSKLLSHLNVVVQMPFCSASQIGKFNKPISKIRKRTVKCNKPTPKSYKLKPFLNTRISCTSIQLLAIVPQISKLSTKFYINNKHTQHDEQNAQKPIYNQKAKNTKDQIFSKKKN